MAEAHVTYTMQFSDAPGEPEAEKALLDNFAKLATVLGDRVTAAGWDGPTTGAVNLHEHATANPDHESDAMSPEAKAAFDAVDGDDDDDDDAKHAPRSRSRSKTR